MAQLAEDPSVKPTAVGERTALGWFVDGVQALKYGFCLVVLGGAAAAFAAAASAPHDQFITYWVLFSVAIVAAMAGVLLGLRFLRHRRFGNAPPTSPVSSIHVFQGLGGILAAGGGMLICVPRLLTGKDLQVWSLGTALCALALFFIVRDALYYVTRP